jgi:hypothetical protein
MAVGVAVKRRRVRAMTAPIYRWTDADQAAHIKSVKRDLAELLEDMHEFSLMERAADSSCVTQPVKLLLLYLTELRSELLAWCNKA